MRTRAAPGERAAYIALLTFGIVDAAGYSVIAPVLPALAGQYDAGPALMGLLVATFPSGMIAGFALAGIAVRRTSPVWVVLSGLGLIAVGGLGFVLSSGLPVYAAARLAMGVGSGFLWLGITFATLARWPDQQYLCMSRVFAAYSVGGLVGPLLGSVDGVRGPFVVYTALVIAVVPMVFVLRGPAGTAAFRSDRVVLRSRGFWAASAGIAFAVLALGTLEGVLPLHFGVWWSQQQIGVVYAGISLLVAVSAVLAARIRPHRVLLAATVPVVAGLVIAGAGTAAAVWIGALVVTGVGIGMANTGAIGVLLDVVPAQRIVTAMVLWSQIGIAGYLLAPLLGGPIAAAHGYAAAATSVAVCALVVVVGLTRSDGAGSRRPRRER